MRWNCKFCRYCEYLFAIGNRSPCYGCKKGSNFELSKIYDVKPAQSYKPMTNGDRIRAMSDEELAKFIPDWSYTNACKLSEEVYIDCNNECEKCVAEWLKQPVEVDHDTD